MMAFGEALAGLTPAHLFVGLLALLAVCTLAVNAIKGASRWIPVSLRLRAVPTAPGGNWLLGNALELVGVCPWDKMMSWVEGGSKIIRFRILHRTGLIVSDPYDVRRIFQTRQRLYSKDTDFSYRPFLSILGTGLVTANGAAWQQQRLLMAPAFRVDMLDAILPITQRATDRLCEKLEAAKARGEVVDLNEELRLLTLQVIGEAILSLPADECDRVFPALYLPVMEESNRRVLAPWRALYPVQAAQYSLRVRSLDRYIGSVIHSRREVRAEEAAAEAAVKGAATVGDHEGSDTAGAAATFGAKDGAAAPRVPGRTRDILDRVIDSLDAKGTRWTPAVTRQLTFELKTFLLAGHETSAAMLSWSLYELSVDPKKAAIVAAEAERALPEAASWSGSGAALPSSPSPRHAAAEPERPMVEAMSYTLACLKESLRKYSVVPVVTRNLEEDDELSGERIPKGSWLIVHLKAVHHLCYKDPLVWEPERYMPGGEYDSFPEEIRPYHFLPFTQGPRNCLGQYFALLEARVILGLLIRRFNFTPLDAAKQGIVHPSVIPTGPLHGMDMRIN